jgi:polygalacturonase
MHRRGVLALLFWKIGSLSLLLIVASASTALADPPLPVIASDPAHTFTVPAATGNSTTDTNNLKNTITSAVNAGGGTVVVPAGTYVSNLLTLSSNIRLSLSAGATIQDATAGATLIHTSGSNLSNIEISGSGTIDGRATATSSNHLIDLQNVNTLQVKGVTIQNSGNFHLVVENDNNMTIDGININDNFTVTQHGGYLSNTDAIDYSGQHILIKNSSINSGDDDIVAKPSGVFVSDVTITNDTIGAGHGISIGGQTQSGMDGLNVNHITFNGTDNGLRLKSGAAAIQTSGGGGVVKNVTFDHINMTNVRYPLIINSWYNAGDHYGSQELSPTALHDPTQFNVSNPGDPTVNVDQQNNGTNEYPFWDNITYSNITATGGLGEVAIIYGLNSNPAHPTDPLRNIDNLSFSNVNLSGAYGADIYYVSQLDLSGLTVSAANGNNINQFGNSVPEPGGVVLMGAVAFFCKCRRRRL